MENKIKKGKVRYPCKVAGTLYPAGTVVELCGAMDERVQSVFPGIQYNIKSSQVAVVFPERETATICHKSQIELIEEDGA